MHEYIKNFFLTGPPKSGKTTLLNEIIENLKRRGVIISGIMCPEVIINRRRWGFKIIDIKTGREGILASIEIKSGPRVSKYGVNLMDLEEIGINALITALNDESNVVVIDEIGKMELFSEKFEQAVRRLLASGKPVIGVISYTYNHPLIREIKSRKDCKVYVIRRDSTLQHRLRIKNEIIRRILEILR